MQSDSQQTSRPVRDTLARIWKAISHRPVRKLAALLIAVAFWAIVIANDPSIEVEKTLPNALVTVSGQEALRINKGLIVMDDLSTEALTTKMRVQVKNGDYEAATAERFLPRLDLSSQITQAGTQEVFFSAGSTTYGTVLSFDPPSITVTVEPYASRSRVPVNVEMTGESTTPLWVSGAQPDPSQITVAGPKSLVDQVSRAVVQLPLSSLNEARQQDRLSGLIQLRDANDKVLSSPLLRITSDSIPVDSVNIDMSVFPQREVPVNTERAVTGLPAHGYVVTDVRVTPDKVAVAADQDILGEVEWLYVQTPMDVTGMTESVTMPVSLRSVSGTQNVAVTEVMLEIDIAPAEHVHTYINLPVLVMGRDLSLSERLSHPEMDVFIRGKYDEVQGLGAQDITLYVDASGLDAGVHMLPVQCLVNGTEHFEFEPELPNVTLTLTDQAGE